MGRRYARAIARTVAGKSGSREHQQPAHDQHGHPPHGGCRCRSIAAGKKIDGINFLPLWLGKTSNGPREVFYYYFGNNNLEGVRYRHWKLVLAHPTSTYAALHGKDGKPGVTSRVDVPMALYDLSHDPGEAYDVQKLYPEIVQKLLVMADDAREDMGDDLTNRKGANMRPPAVVE